VELVVYEAVVVCKSDKRLIIRLPATYCLVDFDFDFEDFFRRSDMSQ